MLRIDIRELRKGPVGTDGVIPVDDPLFEGLNVPLTRPVEVSGEFETTGRGDFIWRGRLAAQLHNVCGRCLKEFVRSFGTDVKAVFSADQELQDDPSVYPLVEPVTHVDITGAVREELALAIPQYPLCRDDCPGLCRSCGADLNQGPCGCASPAPQH